MTAEQRAKAFFVSVFPVDGGREDVADLARLILEAEARGLEDAAKIAREVDATDTFDGYSAHHAHGASIMRSHIATALRAESRRRIG